MLLVVAVFVGVVAFAVGRSTASSDGAGSAAIDLAVATPVDPSPSTTTTPTTVPRHVAGARLPAGPATVYVLGDSVTLATENTVPAALSGWDVTFDAKESRRIDQGIDIVASRRAPIARVLVVHLCTNWWGGDYAAAAERLLEAAQGVDRIVWVTCVPWRPEVDAAIVVIRSLPQRHPYVVVADWAVLADQPGYTAGDRLHLHSPGVRALTSLIAGSVGPPPLVP